MRKVFSEYCRQLQENTNQLPIVKFTYWVTNILQIGLTLSGHARVWFYAYNKKKEFRGVLTAWILAKLAIAFGVNLLFQNHAVTLFLNMYILWEAFIVNLWLFLFRQGASLRIKPKDDTEAEQEAVIKESNIRVLILLYISFMTVVFCFAGLQSMFFGVNFYDGIYSSISTFIGGVPTEVATPSQKTLISIEILYGLFFMMLFFAGILNQLRFDWAKEDK